MTETPWLSGAVISVSRVVTSLAAAPALPQISLDVCRACDEAWAQRSFDDLLHDEVWCPKTSDLAHIKKLGTCGEGDDMNVAEVRLERAAQMRMCHHQRLTGHLKGQSLKLTPLLWQQQLNQPRQRR